MGNPDCTFTLIAVKRNWVPEWLFAMFKWVIPFQPFRWVFTTPVQEGDKSDEH